MLLLVCVGIVVMVISLLLFSLIVLISLLLFPLIFYLFITSFLLICTIGLFYNLQYPPHGFDITRYSHRVLNKHLNIGDNNLPHSLLQAFVPHVAYIILNDLKQPILFLQISNLQPVLQQLLIP